MEKIYKKPLTKINTTQTNHATQFPKRIYYRSTENSFNFPEFFLIISTILYYENYSAIRNTTKRHCSSEILLKYTSRKENLMFSDIARPLFLEPYTRATVRCIYVYKIKTVTYIKKNPIHSYASGTYHSYGKTFFFCFSVLLSQPRRSSGVLLQVLFHLTYNRGVLKNSSGKVNSCDMFFRCVVFVLCLVFFWVYAMNDWND